MVYTEKTADEWLIKLPFMWRILFRQIYPCGNFSTKDDVPQYIPLAVFLKWSLIKVVDNQSNVVNIYLRTVHCLMFNIEHYCKDLE